MLVFNTFWNVDRALRKQLLGAVEDNFVRVKHMPQRGYSGSITLDLLTHLYKTYAVISNTDWLANNKRFCEAYASTDPIEVVWRQLENTRCIRQRQLHTLLDQASRGQRLTACVQHMHFCC